VRAPDRLDRILALVRAHRPKVRLRDRHEVAWLRWPGEVFGVLVPGFNERFTTVIGDRVYLPGPVASIERDRLAAVLAHELVHQIDQRRWGPLFYLSYALLPPVGRTARAAWERRAYAVDLLLAHERHGPQGVARLHDHLADLFAGPAYAFMWVGRRAAWRYLQPTARDVLDGSLATREPYASILAAWRGEPVAEGPAAPPQPEVF